MKRLALLATASALALASGCASRATDDSDSGTVSGALLELDGKRLARNDLPAEVRGALQEVDAEAYEKTNAILTEYAVRASLAKEKGTSVASADNAPLTELLAVKAPTDETVKSFYEANKDRIPPGASYEDVKPRIAEYLEQKAAADAFHARVADLEAKKAFRVLARAPEALAVELDLTGFPSRGAANAKVVVVEASDYLCPHCRNAQTRVDALFEKHGARVRFVQVNFALRPEGLSGTLVKGSHCAAQQGETHFWTWHKAAFEAKPTDGKTDVETARALADTLGLARPAFDACLASADATRAMSEALRRMANAGVKGTPTFFVNGRKVELPALEGAVERELARAGVASR